MVRSLRTSPWFRGSPHGARISTSGAEVRGSAGGSHLDQRVGSLGAAHYVGVMADEGGAERAAAARTVGLTKTYGTGDARVVALDAVDVELHAGEFTAVMGPSGSGKSTLMHCCAALDAASSGRGFIGETELTALNDKELPRLRRDEIGFVFQSFNLVPTLPAEENILLPLSIAGRRPDP